MVAPPSTQGAAFHRRCSGRGRGETSCSSRNGSSPLLARSAKQGGGRAILASQRARRNCRRRATRSRRLDCPRRVRVANQGGTHSGTVPAGRGSRGGSRGGTAGTRGAGLVFGKTRIALLAKFWLTRAPGRAFGGRAAVARLPKSYATACDLDSARELGLASGWPIACEEGVHTQTPHKTPHTVSSVPRRPARLLEVEHAALASHVTSCRLLFVVPLFVSLGTLECWGGRQEECGPELCVRQLRVCGSQLAVCLVSLFVSVCRSCVSSSSV
mmetsp:Transcript_2190/g.6522  ORF Transcript_2190/g.6522 Transcript_2190/m.6522 type:complete len:271 (-) Transcript_2190:91-903(-)